MTDYKYNKISCYLDEIRFHETMHATTCGTLSGKIPFSICSFNDLTVFFSKSIMAEYEHEVIRKYFYDFLPDFYNTKILLLDDCSVIIIEYEYIEERYYEELSKNREYA